ncbi:diphthine methyl ester synthase-like [Gordionus sp. m RMFG-2023]|uniref:diphthine methyl ester synthase-like n=1 Tax=Gordionus sp. m RMFG-2023 TaxID=3053472 RepID=UPI0031FBF597
MLYLIGLGLSGVDDITIKSYEIIKDCDKIYMDIYTSILIGTDKKTLELYYEKPINYLNRELLEESDDLIKEALSLKICLLIIGDPLSATTHSEIILRCIDNNVKYKVLHNSSIITAVGDCGLQIYKFGEIVSIVAWDEFCKPASFYDKIIANMKRGLHTLCLLDIKIQEKSIENIIKNRPIYEPPYFLTINKAIYQLLEISKSKLKEDPDNALINLSTKGFGLARMGNDNQKIVSGKMEELLNFQFGLPLHSLVIVGELHDVEQKFYEYFSMLNYI